MDASDAGQSSTTVAARSGANEEAGRRSEEHAARTDAEYEAGRGGAEDAAQPGAGGDAGRDDAVDAARSGAGGGETGRDASEHPASQTEGDVLTPEHTGLGMRVPQTAAVEVPAEEMLAAVASADETPGSEVPAEMETLVEEPWEVAVAATTVASVFEGGLDT